MTSSGQPSKMDVLRAAHILENFAKKGMVGYRASAIEGGAKRKGARKGKKTGAKKAAGGVKKAGGAKRKGARKGKK